MDIALVMRFPAQKVMFFGLKRNILNASKVKHSATPEKEKNRFFILFSVFGHTLLLRWLYALADILQLSEMYMMFFSGIRKREKMS